MALFSNSNSNSSEQPMAKQNGPTPGQVNMIGEGAVLEGTLKTESDVRISGRHIGKLMVGGKVSIAQEGAVEGEIYAAAADISGHVNGDLHIDERLLLRGTAHVEGNITATRLIMEEGAVFNGKSQIGPSSNPTKASVINGTSGKAKPPAAEATAENAEAENAEATAENNVQKAAG